MVTSVIWIGRAMARVYLFSRDKMERHELVRPGTAETQGGVFEANQDPELRSWFDELAGLLATAGQIMLLGPGMPKHHFQTYLIEHFPKQAKLIVSCESVEDPTDQQIADLVSKVLGSKK